MNVPLVVQPEHLYKVTSRAGPTRQLPRNTEQHNIQNVKLPFQMGSKSKLNNPGTLIRDKRLGMHT